MIVGVVAFVVALLVSVMLHEAGHFVTAKRFGMKATQFFVGFGPTLWSFRRGETEYGVKAIPAGGFVKIIGMTPLEDVETGDEPRAFFRQRAWQRSIVLAAGSTVHFIIAIVLLLIVLMGSGVANGNASTTIDQVAACVPADSATASCPKGAPPSPALAAGLKSGDKVVGFQGKPVKGWDAFSKLVQKHGAGPVSVTVLRDGQRLTVHPTLVAAMRPDPDHPSEPPRAVGVLGIAATPEIERLGPISALGKAGSGFGQTTVATFKALGHIPSAIPQLFRSTVNDSPRDPNGLVGPVGAARIGGEALGTSDEPLALRISDFLLVIATINIFIGIFNLLPLLPLDGGHLAVLGFEEGRKRLYRLFGKADPGRVDLTKLLPAAYLVVALFVGLSVLLLYSDIVNPVANPFG
jgi:membrane-associated protease RseP (regulator of RpoE activity)